MINLSHAHEVILLPIGDILPIDELAALVSMASDAEQQALQLDIDTNGLQEPLITWKGKIIDGRCRQKACLEVGVQIRYKEIGEANAEDVELLVHSMNTRRNLTHTQKAMCACRASKRRIKGRYKQTVEEIAKSWGLSRDLLANARFIDDHDKTMSNHLFEGKTVEIIDAKGNVVLSNKVTAVYAHLKRKMEAVAPVGEHGFSEDAYIKTQVGKDWYRDFMKRHKVLRGNTPMRMEMAGLANRLYPEAAKEPDKIQELTNQYKELHLELLRLTEESKALSLQGKENRKQLLAISEENGYSRLKEVL